MSLITRLRRAEALAVVAVAGACIAFQLYVPTLHVDDADYRAVAQALETQAQPTDAVLLWPWWTERARLFLPAGLSVVGYLGSDAADLPAAPRIWVLGQPRQPRAGRGDFEAAFGPGRTPLGPPQRFGNLTLELFQNGRARPTAFSLAAALPTAQVWWETPAGERQVCPWTGRGHRCPSGSQVEVAWHEVHFEPLPCVTMDAPPGRASLVVELGGVPAAAEVVLRAGYIWETAGYRDGVTDSRLLAEVNGQRTELLLPRGVEVMHRRDLGAVAAGSSVRVALEAPDPAHRRVCVELTGFAPRGER